MENSCGCVTYWGATCEVDVCVREIGGKRKYMNKRARAHESYEPTQIEHMANTASHALVIPVSVWGVFELLAVCQADVEHKASLLYGIAICLLFCASSAYHSFEMFFRPRYRGIGFWLHVLDRSMIYVYVAASYTPWLLIRDCGRLGIVMNYVTWSLATFGILYQYIFHERFKRVETALYVVIGLCPAIPVVFVMSDHSGLLTLAYSGIAYCVGIVFFKMDGVIPFAHAIWHCHVILGAGLQYLAVYVYLLHASPVSSHNLSMTFENHTEL